MPRSRNRSAAAQHTGELGRRFHDLLVAERHPARELGGVAEQKVGFFLAAQQHAEANGILLGGGGRLNERACQKCHAQPGDDGAQADELAPGAGHSGGAALPSRGQRAGLARGPRRGLPGARQISAQAADLAGGTVEVGAHAQCKLEIAGHLAGHLSPRQPCRP